MQVLSGFLFCLSSKSIPHFLQGYTLATSNRCPILTEIVHGEIVAGVGVQRVGVARSDLGGENPTPDQHAAVGAAGRHQILAVVRPAHVGHVTAVARVLPEAAALFLVGTGRDEVRRRAT